MSQRRPSSSLEILHHCQSSLSISDTQSKNKNQRYRTKSGFISEDSHANDALLDQHEVYIWRMPDLHRNQFPTSWTWWKMKIRGELKIPYFTCQTTTIFPRIWCLFGTSPCSLVGGLLFNFDDVEIKTLIRQPQDITFLFSCCHSRDTTKVQSGYLSIRSLATKLIWNSKWTLLANSQKRLNTRKIYVCSRTELWVCCCSTFLKSGSEFDDHKNHQVGNPDHLSSRLVSPKLDLNHLRLMTWSLWRLNQNHPRTNTQPLEWFISLLCCFFRWGWEREKNGNSGDLDTRQIRDDIIVRFTSSSTINHHTYDRPRQLPIKLSGTPKWVKIK